MGKNGVVAGAIVAIVVIAAGAYYFLAGGGGGGGGGAVSGDQLRQFVDAQIKKVPAGISVTYKSIDGDTVKGMAMHWASDQASFDVTVDETQFVNPNLGFGKAWDDAVANPKALTPDTAIPVYDSATLKGVSFHLTAKEKFGGDQAQADVTGSLASATSKAVRLYPWAMAQTGVPSFAEVQALLAKPASQVPDLQAAMPVLRFAAAGALSFGDGGQTMENMKLTVKLPPMPGLETREVTYEVKKGSSTGQDRAVVNGMAIEGISAKMGSEGSATLDRVSYGGYDLRKALGKVLTAQTLTPDMLDGIKIGKIEYAGVAIQPPKNVPPVQLQSFAISDIVFSGPVPISGGFSLQGLKISKAQMPDAQSQMGFDQLGLDTMTISMGASYNWDLAKKSIKVHDVMLKVEELGTVTLGADVAEITPDLAGAMGAQLVHAKLQYADNSLVDRAFTAMAKMQGADPAQFRKQATGMVQMMSAQFADSPPLAAASKAVMDFLGAPKSLTVELSPPKPLPIMQLSMLAGGGAPPAQIATMVGLLVTANK